MTFEEALMRCSNCHNGDVVDAHHHKSATRGRHVAVVTDVPVEQCPASGVVWYSEEVPIALDAMLTEMLAGDQFAVRNFTVPHAA